MKIAYFFQWMMNLSQITNEILKLVILFKLTRWWIVCLDNCIRQATGYCRIQYKESSISSPDPFQLDTQTGGSTTAAGGLYPPTPTAVPCHLTYVTIPQGSEDGVTILNTLFSTIPFQSQWCGSSLGYTNKAFPMFVTCKFSWEHQIYSSYMTGWRKCCTYFCICCTHPNNFK